MKYDSIILDIDGTIWNTTGIVADAWNEAIKENYPQVKSVTAEILQTQFGKTMAVIADNLFTNLNQEEKNILMNKCCEKEQLFLHNNTKNITYDGVIETIKRLSDVTKVFIVSNCQNGYIEVVIAKNGIEQYITDFECYGRTLLGKADNIKLIMERNKLKNTVYVGDTQGDYEACVEAKVPFIWASYGFGKPDSYTAKIDSFSELLKFFKD